MKVGDLVGNYTRIGVIVERVDKDCFDNRALKVVWTSGDWGWFCEMNLVEVVCE